MELASHVSKPLLQPAGAERGRPLGGSKGSHMSPYCILLLFLKLIALILS